MANKLGNGLTYGKFILIMIATRTLSIAAAHGINLPMSDVELAGYLGLLAGFIYSILDSYFKTTSNGITSKNSCQKYSMKKYLKTKMKMKLKLKLMTMMLIQLKS